MYVPIILLACMEGFQRGWLAPAAVVQLDDDALSCVLIDHEDNFRREIRWDPKSPNDKLAFIDICTESCSSGRRYAPGRDEVHWCPKCNIWIHLGCLGDELTSLSSISSRQQYLHENSDLLMPERLHKILAWPIIRGYPKSCILTNEFILNTAFELWKAKTKWEQWEDRLKSLVCQDGETALTELYDRAIDEAITLPPPIRRLCPECQSRWV